MTNEKKSEQLAEAINGYFLEPTVYEAGYTCAMEMAQYKDEYYKRIIDVLVRIFKGDSETIRESIDTAWCDQHCNAFANAECVFKWLDEMNEKIKQK